MENLENRGIVAESVECVERLFNTVYKLGFNEGTSKTYKDGFKDGYEKAYQEIFEMIGQLKK